MPLSAGFELVDEAEAPAIDAHPVALPLGSTPVGACPVGHNVGVVASAVAVAALADDASTKFPDGSVPTNVLLGSPVSANPVAEMFVLGNDQVYELGVSDPP